MPFASKLVLHLASVCSAPALLHVSAQILFVAPPVVTVRLVAMPHHRLSHRPPVLLFPCTADPFSAAPLHLASALFFSPATPHFPWRCQCLSVISSQCLYTSIRCVPRSASPSPCRSRPLVASPCHRFAAPVFSKPVRCGSCAFYSFPFHGASERGSSMQCFRNSARRLSLLRLHTANPIISTPFHRPASPRWAYLFPYVSYLFTASPKRIWSNRFLCQSNQPRSVPCHRRSVLGRAIADRTFSSPWRSLSPLFSSVPKRFWSKRFPCCSSPVLASPKPTFALRFPCTSTRVHAEPRYAPAWQV